MVIKKQYDARSKITLREAADLPPATRIGFGWDSHEFQAGIPLKIGGVTLAYNKGLGGQSDGDRLLHALTDTLLAVAGAPVLRSLYPPTDPQWNGAGSVVFLNDALKRVREA